MRKGLLVFVAACTTLALAAPAAVADEPQIFHIHGVDRGPTDPVSVPAGVACPFAMRIDSEGKITHWLFSDGHEAASNNYTRTLTNLDVGTSVEHRSVYHTTTYHREDGTTLQTSHGSFLFIFFEGDEGLNGIVGPGGETYFMTGTATVVFDADFVVTSFSFDGQATDVCQLLSA